MERKKLYLPQEDLNLTFLYRPDDNLGNKSPGCNGYIDP